MIGFPVSTTLWQPIIEKWTKQQAVPVVRPAVCIYKSVLITEIKEFNGLYAKNITNLKYHIQGNSTICRFNPAHMGAADIDAFRKLALG